MVTAFVLIKAEPDRIGEASQEILELKGVGKVFSVAGDYDIIAVACVPESKQLETLVTEDMATVQGVTKTNTLIGFQHYNKHDLEGLFDSEW